ncbi:MULTISPECIES: hypothetical protein [Halorussus]|uniref:hypothetical protein n=1 Tax=Halorussus TaxID=1070314 RepID=UPI000E20F80C|nr:MULTISPECIES: hypothetical protein [Halorussus]NHN59508.1 hypothetical protein [Halorussus sp. JP-T4]
MTRPNAALAGLLVVLVVSAGCLGASGGPTSHSTSETATTLAGPTTDSGGSPATATVDCPDSTDRYRAIATDRVAGETGSDAANVSVVNDAFVDYPLLGECYYSAKVRDRESGRTLGVFVAENGTVVDREAVEARAERAYERKYGNVSRELFDQLQSADQGEEIPVAVSVADINRTAVKQAVDRENLTDTEYKQALQDEYERRADNRTAEVAARLRDIQGVTVERTGWLRVDVRATPAAVEAMQDLDGVTWLDYRRQGTTTYLD